MLRWRQLPEPAWSPRAASAMACLSEGRILLLGGYDGKRPLREVWCSDNAGADWKQLPNPPWGARLRAATTALLPERGKLMLAGGEEEGGRVLRDVWTSTTAGESWQQLPTPAWPARSGAAIVQTQDGHVLLLGGWSGDRHLCDVWRWQVGMEHDQAAAGSGWQLLPEPGWCARENASAVCLPGGSIVILGGYSAEGEELRDTWISSDIGTTWSRVRTPEWPGRGFASAVPLDSGILLLGGAGSGNRMLGDAWDSNQSCTRWRKLPMPPFAARSGASCGKVLGGKAVLAGGMDQESKLLRDVWVLDNAQEVLTPTSASMQGLSNAKFNAMKQKQIDKTAGGSMEAIARDLSNYIMAFARKELEAQHSALPRELRTQVEAKLKEMTASGPLYEYVVSSHGDQALLVIDARVTITKERRLFMGSLENSFHVKGTMRYFEATSESAFQDLCEVARRKALASYTTGGEGNSVNV